MREHKGKLDLVVDGLGVASALKRHAESSGTGPEGRASEAKRGHHIANGCWKRW
jgi:hypothetical protein